MRSFNHQTSKNRKITKRRKEGIYIHITMMVRTSMNHHQPKIIK